MKDDMYETYWKETPWICITYLMTDEEADANNGQSKALFDCCICGEVKEVTFNVPAKDDPIVLSGEVARQGTPEGRKLIKTFQLNHLHPDKHAAPMMQWKKPLRNVAAIGGFTPTNIEQLKL